MSVSVEVYGFLCASTTLYRTTQNMVDLLTAALLESHDISIRSCLGLSNHYHRKRLNPYKNGYRGQHSNFALFLERIEGKQMLNEEVWKSAKSGQSTPNYSGLR